MKKANTKNNSKATQNKVEHIFSQAFSLHQQGYLDQAENLYGQVLKLRSNHFDALHLLGVIAFKKQAPLRALELLDKALKQDIKHPVVYFNRGNVLHSLARYEEAIESFTQALAIFPQYADAYHNRGFAYRELKQFSAALSDFDFAIQYHSDDADAFNNRGLVRHELKHYDLAVNDFQYAIRLNPDAAEVYNNLGITYESLRQYAQALANYAQAIALKANFAEAYNNRGNALQSMKQFVEAKKNYDIAIGLNPDYIDAYVNRGVVLSKLYQHAAAIQDHKYVIERQAQNFEAYNNLGNTLHALGRYDEAIQAYQIAVSLNSKYAEAHCNLAFCYLLQGNFQLGWEKYEWRRSLKALELYEQNYVQACWDGVATLQGKTILLHSEQGLGDSIQFCRYVRLVADLGAKIVFEVDQALLELFKSLNDVDRLIAKGSVLPDYDYHLPLLSLPRIFNTHLANIPACQSYLATDPSKVQYWEQALGQKKCPRIGLVWSGALDHVDDHNRSIPFYEFCKLLSDRFQFVCLQKELRKADAELLLEKNEVLFFGEELHDFTDTAALCAVVDLVISVDTSVAHLAGALGKSVWVLLPFSPDWRWMLHRSESPWYPSAKLFRQSKIGDWEGVVQTVKQELLHFDG